MSHLLSWILAATATLAPGRPHDALAGAIAHAALAEPPLFKGDDDREKTAALLVAVAFREGSLREGIVGDHVAGHPTSFCTFQINLPFHHKTKEGWSGEDLTADPDKCALAALHMMQTSLKVCPRHPLAWYAEGPNGCGSERAQRISRDRLALAERLVRVVPEPPADLIAPAGEQEIADALFDVVGRIFRME